MRVLIIGAAGRVGSAALAACLAKNHTVTAFVRTPSKLPLEVRSHPRLRVVKGDATSHASLVEAIRDQDAIIQAAVYGSNSPYGTSDSELVIRCITRAIQEVQAQRRAKLGGGGGGSGAGVGARRDRPIRLWVLSGQVLMDLPGKKGVIEGDVIPIHPEHYKNYAFLQQEARDVDWSLLCPGRIEMGEPIGPIVMKTNEVPLWQQAGLVGSIPILGTFLNVLYNFKQQRLTYQSVGSFLVDHLDEGGDLRGKRVGILEDPSKGKDAPVGSLNE